MPMPRHKILEVLTEGVGEHRAVQAWLQLQSDSWEPGSLEVLQRRRYSTVYRLNHATQHRMGVIAKRCRTARARLERFILGELLPRTGMPVLACYGLLEDPDGDFCWLFLEDAAGCFYSPQLPDHRALAGYWLAEIQLTTAAADFKSLLPNRELDYYLQLLRNCQAIVHSLYGTPLSAEDTALFRKIAIHLDVLESHWSELEKISELMPPALVHGDFVIKNLRIRETDNGPALLAFDWEFAGWGLPAADLAQSIDRAASPDLSIYCSVLNRGHPHLDLHDIEAVAACGNLLRLINQMSWATAGLEFALPAQLLKAIPTLRFYEPAMPKALTALRWS